MVSHPVKVRDELYAALWREADAGGITVMAALEKHLAAKDRRIGEPATEKSRVMSELAAAQDQAVESGELRAAAQRSESQLRARLQTLDAEISNLAAERDRFSDAIAEWREHSESLEQQLREARVRGEREKRAAGARVAGAWIFALIVAGVASWVAYRQIRGAAQDEEARGPGPTIPEVPW